MNAYKNMGPCKAWLLDYETHLANRQKISELETEVDMLRQMLIEALDSIRDIEEAAYETYDGDRTVKLLLMPNGHVDVYGDEDLNRIFEEFVLDEDEILFDDKILTRYRSEDVITVDDVKYLMGPMVIYEIDVDGNPCSINRETIENTLDFFEMNLVEINMFGDSVQALCLV